MIIKLVYSTNILSQTCADCHVLTKMGLFLSRPIDGWFTAGHMHCIQVRVATICYQNHKIFILWTMYFSWICSWQFIIDLICSWNIRESCWKRFHGDITLFHYYTLQCFQFCKCIWINIWYIWPNWKHSSSAENYNLKKLKVLDTLHYALKSFQFW